MQLLEDSGARSGFSKFSREKLTKSETIRVIICAIICFFALASSIITIISEDSAINVYEVGNWSKLPPTFKVVSDFDTAMTYNTESSMDAYEAVAEFLEMNYHKQSIEKGSKNLKANEYVKFSPYSIKKALTSICKSHSHMACYSLNKDNISSALILDAAFKYPFLFASILPEASCGENGQLSCDISKPTVSASINSFSWAQTVTDIKNLLLNNKRPLLLSLPSPYIHYEFPCSLSEASQECEILSTPCSFRILNFSNINDQFCFSKLLKAQEFTGEYFLPKGIPDLYLGNSKSFIIVGYSDDYIPQMGNIPNIPLSHTYSEQGGFIVKPASIDSADLNKIGYPINFFTGEITSSLAYSICPNMKTARFWEGSSSSTPTILSCISKKSSVCDSTSKYIIKSYSKYPLPGQIFHMSESIDGFSQIEFVQPEESSEVKIEGFPISRLGEIFEPEITVYNGLQCGYWFIPYELIETIQAKDGEGGSTNRIFAIDAQISFSDSSFIDKISNSDLKEKMKQSIKSVPQRLNETWN